MKLAMVGLYAVACWCLGSMAGTCLKVPSAEQIEQVEAVERWVTVEVWPSRELLNALAWVESSGLSRAVSEKGARGLYQIMEGTWDDMMEESWERAFEPDLNEIAAIRYLMWIRDTLWQWRGTGPTLEDVLACWHGGIGRYRRNGYEASAMPESTKVFIERVMDRLKGGEL